MTRAPRILVIRGAEDAPAEVVAALAERGDLETRVAPDIPGTEQLAAVDLVIITEDANRSFRVLRPRLRDRSLAPIVLLRANSEEVPRGHRLFDDSAFPSPLSDFMARVELLLEFREMWRRSEDLGVTPEMLREEFKEYGLGPGLVGPWGLTPPGRIALHTLVDVDAVNKQQMAICRLMGTAYGTFLHSWRPRGLVREGGQETSPTGVLSPYCAYLSSQGGRCEGSEYHAALRSLAQGRPVESSCEGCLKLYTVPVCLKLKGIRWPLFAATVAVGMLPSAETIERVAVRYRVNAEILQQIGEESRFWFLNPDKVGGIKETFGNLAVTVSREVSHKYATAFQLVQRILNERAVQRSERLLSQSHRTLEEANRKLTLKNEEIYEVTHAITHDLRKPLVSVKAMIGVLKGGRLGKLTDTQAEAVDTAQEASGYMAQLVEDLLEAARLDTGRRTLDICQVELRPILERIRKRFQFQLDEKEVQFRIGDIPETLPCDENSIEKVLMNLIGNSLAYIGDGENRIEVFGEEAGREVRVTVRDTGIGIPEESQATVFDKFKRGENVAGIRGTGLGLAIVQGVTEAHGGRVTLLSREGGGTSVTIALPREPVACTPDAGDWANDDATGRPIDG